MRADPPRIRPTKTSSRADGHHWPSKSTRDFEAKIWLESREGAFNYGLASPELNDIEDIITPRKLLEEVGEVHEE